MFFAKISNLLVQDELFVFLAAKHNFSLIKDLRDKLNTSPLQPSYSFGFLETCGAVIIKVDNRTEWVYLYTIL